MGNENFLLEKLNVNDGIQKRHPMMPYHQGYVMCNREDTGINILTSVAFLEEPFGRNFKLSLPLEPILFLNNKV